MEAKGFSLAILGDLKVGKSSLCQILTGKQINNKYEPTNGCEYYQKIYEDGKNNQMMKIDIYCASGDKKSLKLSKFLYKDAICIIMMFNLSDTSTFKNLKIYLENIRLNSVEEPLLYLVGNFSEQHCRVTDQMINDFKKDNDINDTKFFKISCTDARSVKELLDEITKDVLLSEKYYTSTIDKDISDTSSMDDGTKEIEKMTKTLKTFYKETKDKKPNFMRCKNCDRLLYIKFRNTYNEVSFTCNYCNTENNISIDKAGQYIDQLSSKVVCFECLKTKEDKTKLEYCNKCKHYVCPSCKKSIQKQLIKDGSEMHRLFPYYLMDVLCFDHGKKILGYCKECKKGICILCFESHKGHENIFYENFVSKLLDEHNKELGREISNMKQLQENFERCINALKVQFNYFIQLKTLEINLKRCLLNQLNVIRYNQQLIETIKNMKYLKIKKLNIGSWDKMLQGILDTIGQPIQIYNVNISKKTNKITPNTIDLCNRNIEDEDNRNRIAESMKDITDICNMNNDNDSEEYIGIGYNTGELELYTYKNLMKNFKTLNKYDIFINEPINSIHKSALNINNYFFCSKGKIVNVEFYNKFKTMKTNMKIEDPERNFKFALDQENFIVAFDKKNNIILYDKEGNQIGDVTDSIAKQGIKDIIKVDEVMNNVIYINYSKSLDEPNAAPEIENSLEADEGNAEVSMVKELANVKEHKLSGTKIIEFNDENYKIKREHILTDSQEIIGVLNNRLALIRDDEYKSVILFDGKSFKNVQRFYFESGEKPIFGSILAKRDTFIDFLLISDQLKMIQNIYDEEHKSINKICGLKVEDVDKYKEIIKKEGKFILIPAKGFIKYIGENKFIFINYDLY